jgi:hypothetical protein
VLAPAAVSDGGLHRIISATLAAHGSSALDYRAFEALLGDADVYSRFTLTLV